VPELDGRQFRMICVMKIPGLCERAEPFPAAVGKLYRGGLNV